MIQNKTVSICIPTYKRPDLLAVALASCFAQDYCDYEIVIGDNSPDDKTAQIIEEYVSKYPQTIRYKHHSPALDPNSNMNDLYNRARGGRLLLLHDDDVLLPNALQCLAGCWELAPELDAAFGKQLLINHDGTAVAPDKSEELNRTYYRVPSNAGLQRSPLFAGIVRMFPNDGFMVSAELARQTGYRSREEVGDAADVDFGIRFCGAAKQVWFLDKFTCEYRLTKESISKTAVVRPYTYDILVNLEAPPELQSILSAARRELAPSAASGFARLGRTRRAISTFFSPDYTMRRRLTFRGAYHLLLIARSVLGKYPANAFEERVDAVCRWTLYRVVPWLLRRQSTSPTQATSGTERAD